MVSRVSPVDPPLSQVLYRYVWPFWLLKDATRGDRYARAAAYRHNRDMRVHLPGYLMRWLLVSVLTRRCKRLQLPLCAARRNSGPFRTAGGWVRHSFRLLCLRVVRDELHLSVPEPARALT